MSDVIVSVISVTAGSKTNHSIQIVEACNSSFALLGHLITVLSKGLVVCTFCCMLGDDEPDSDPQSKRSSESNGDLLKNMTEIKQHIFFTIVKSLKIGIS